jgi:hypothetical protein
MSATTLKTPHERLTRLLKGTEVLVKEAFACGELEGYAARLAERDLEADGNWTMDRDERGEIVLRHKGEDCPQEFLSSLIMQLLDDLESDVMPEAAAAPPVDTSFIS